MYIQHMWRQRSPCRHICGHHCSNAFFNGYWYLIINCQKSFIKMSTHLFFSFEISLPTSNDINRQREGAIFKTSPSWKKNQQMTFLITRWSLGPVWYHPTILSRALTFLNMAYICSKYSWSRYQTSWSFSSSSKGKAKEFEMSNC